MSNAEVTDTGIAMAKEREIKVPANGLVLLVGISGSGKSSFAAQHFLPTQVISSDFCRGLVADDVTDQTSTPDAFELLHTLVGIRLRRGLLTVVDATNVQPDARKALMNVAKSQDALVDAIVLEVSEKTAVARGREPRVVERQARSLYRSLRGIRKEGFRRVYTITEAEADAAFANPDVINIIPEKPWNVRPELHGPFDIIGDVHGCLDELIQLLVKLGWVIEYNGAYQAVGAHHPDNRTAIFLGDLVDRGPDTPGVLRLVMGMVADGNALAVCGNHEAKLVKALQGRNVNTSHGLAESLAQFELQDNQFKLDAIKFLDGLIAHYVLDDGKLVVAHAGLKEQYHGRTSARVRAFALYGDTTGESDEFGLPVRWPWAREYRGQAMVVYGHTTVPEPEWINNTICLDTGVVFGGALTALRYPEKETVQVKAAQTYVEPARPLIAPSESREPNNLRLSDVVGTRWFETQYGGKVKIPEENAAAALEIMSRFAVDPRWLIYLPPTMSPAGRGAAKRSNSLDDENPALPGGDAGTPANEAGTDPSSGFLEYPNGAFDEYQQNQVNEVICEEKHMGSRAIVVIAKDQGVAERRFGIADGSTGAIYSRTGRAFFPEVHEELLARTRQAVWPLFEQLSSDWLALDCELLPWSAKALPLIKEQFAAIGAASHAALPAAEQALTQAVARGLDLVPLANRITERAVNAELYRDAYAAYVQPTNGLEGVRLAPFQILAGEGELYAATRSHRWHMEQIGQLTDPFIKQTQYRYVDLNDVASREAATQWWLDFTNTGGEGMVVKPVASIAELRADGIFRKKFVQPGLKVRGREYLRIIYGPDYLDSLDKLRNRSLERKKNLAIREYGLGLESLARFVNHDPLWQVHQYAFGVLALESEPVDPQL